MKDTGSLDVVLREVTDQHYPLHPGDTWSLHTCWRMALCPPCLEALAQAGDRTISKWSEWGLGWLTSTSHGEATGLFLIVTYAFQGLFPCIISNLIQLGEGRTQASMHGLCRSAHLLSNPDPLTHSQAMGNGSSRASVSSLRKGKRGSFPVIQDHWGKSMKSLCRTCFRQ